MSRLLTILVRASYFFYRNRLRILSKAISIFIRIVFSCQVSPGAKIGKSSSLGYGGLGTVIHGASVIGENVTIGSNVTLGGNFAKGGGSRHRGWRLYRQRRKDSRPGHRWRRGDRRCQRCSDEGR